MSERRHARQAAYYYEGYKGAMMSEKKVSYALTHPQQRVWYTEKLHPGTGMWNNAGTLKIKGTLETDLLEQAVNRLLQDSDSIRIRMMLSGDEPRQYVEPYAYTSIERLDFTQKGVQELYEWDSIQTQEPMPLLNSPLYYFAIFKLGENEGGIYAKFHHVISDALSIVGFSNRLMEIYQSLLKGTEVPPEPNIRSYIDYIREEEEYFQSKRFAYDAHYWNRRFSELPEPTVIKQKKSNYFSTKARRKAFVIPPALSASIRQYCEDSKISAFSLFLSALAIYINRITNKKDIIISAPVANRTSMAGKGAFGMFVSTVPIRIKIQDELSFVEFAQVVSDEWFSVLKHQKYPYDMLLQDLRKTHKDLDSLYDVTLSYQIGEFKKDEEDFTYEGRWHFSGYQTASLSIHVNDREGDGKFIVDYDHHVPFFSIKEIEYIHTHLINIIRDMTLHPDKPLYMLDILSDEERERILHRFNDTYHEFPEGETLQDLWERQMGAIDKNACALVNQGKGMSYGELDSRSEAVAQYLAGNEGVGPEDIVGLLVGRTEEYCVNMLGILKAGAAFLPIDPDLPRERIVYMLQDSGAKAVLVSPHLTDKCPDRLEADVAILPTDRLPDTVQKVELSRSMPCNLAYVIYTSGSTGRPKGVMIEHRSIVQFAYSINELWDFSPGARMLCAGSISFDLSVMETIPALMFGAVLVFAKEHEANMPHHMVKLIEEQGVNLMMVTPGRMELLLSDPRGPSCLKHFRNVSLGGDVLPKALLERVQGCTKARIMNFYGPTEITIAATCMDVTEASIPNIGSPLFNVKAYILDAHKNPVPIGIPGELYIGGAGIARGYINKPDLNAERFVDNPIFPGEKLYRTGDLTRWYPRGEIEFLGRIDQQIKIRGYRIELGEIESRLKKVEGVTACVVNDYTHEDGRRFLCAYVCGQPPKRSEIKAELARELPAYMVPSYYITVDSLPYNASGKVDKSRLPDPLENEEMLGQEDFIPPETGTEQALAAIWTEILNLPQIGREDSFFDIGGDSLSIIRVMSQVAHRFQVEIPLEEVYRAPRLKDWALLIDAAEAAAYRPILPTAVKRRYPVSSAQQRMWILSQSESQEAAYHIPIAFQLRGKIDVPRLRRAFSKLIERHDALRTSFVLQKGELWQVVSRRAKLEFEHYACAPRQLRTLLKNIMRPFDLQAPPLMRLALVDIGQDRTIMFIDMHHSIGDQRSVEILLNELAELYAGDTLVGKELEYKDYAVWQQEFFQSDEMGRQREFWQEALNGELPLLNLHTDKPRPAVQSFQGKRLRFDVDKKAMDRLADFSKKRGATLFMAVLAAYQVLLSKYTGQEDVIVGFPVSGRGRSELRDMVGVFINTLPLRAYPTGDKSFSQFFDEVCAACVGAMAHGDYPLERMVADLELPRDISRNPLFDTMLVYAKDGLPLQLGELACTFYPFDPGIAKLDLTLEVYETAQGFSCQMEYNTKLFKRATIKRMSTHFLRLLDLLCEQPDRPLSEVSVLTQQELWQVTAGFNQTDCDHGGDGHIHTLLEDLAVSQGDKTALVVDGQRMSFKELNRRTNQIAHALRAEGVGRNTIVALCIRRSFDLMAGLLGILKAGGGYLPLDPSYPKERVSFMLEDSGTAVLLSDGSADIDFGGRVLHVRDIPKTGAAENPIPIDQGEDAAYVIYTSGSTGIPKGGILPHRALYNLYEGTKDTICYDKDQTSVSVTTVSFDIFVVDALLPLLFGCTVVLCTEEELRQPHLLAALVRRENVKFIQTTPTRMRLMMDDADFRAAAGEHIEKIVLGGEEFPLSLLKLLKKYTKARIISGYGPTETTVYCTFKDLSNTSHITIGRPIVNTRMYILDKYKKPVPIGVPGEAYISGDCVATGYINRDELNRQKFSSDPYWPGRVMYQSGDICAFMENGEMEIMGRVDHQIKIRGLRIELGEIEAAMRGFRGVDEAVVMALDEGVDKFLCAYYATEEGVEAEVLRKHLTKRLPAYMVPSYFIGMEKMPLTLNGKVNRKALPVPERGDILQQRGQRPSKKKLSVVERKMARIWTNILKIDNIGSDDSFFALGGDSLSVIKVQAAIFQYGWTVKTQDFYDYQTLGEICKRLNIGGAEEKKRSVVREKRRELVPAYAHLSPPAMQTVLLTGATGYLGAHLLAQLANSARRIGCLLRGETQRAATARLRSNLAFYFGEQKAAALLKYVFVVNGSIHEDNLGLISSQYDNLCMQVDTVIHSAAITDHAGNADAFHRVNVLGTQRIIEMAQDAKAALLHISTVSVSGTHYEDAPHRRGEFTEQMYDVGQNCAENEYAKSKFLAEGAVLEAMDRGLNARIFRVGVLTGRESDGRFQINPEKNAFFNRIQALCAIGCVPRGMLDKPLEMTPVDCCARYILALAAIGQPDCAVYHMFNTNLVTLGKLAGLLEETGRRLEIVSDSAFFQHIAGLSKKGELEHVAGLIEDLNSMGQEGKIRITAERTRQELDKLGHSWPSIDAEYMRRYLDGVWQPENLRKEEPTLC
ncbi:MAG: amino acid adenylation domain-containing protein [Christensenellales bacterium]|jgi:amino acid adenylation domain-containing protein/thioester reductase-like protein